jgi:nitroreductase
MDVLEAVASRYTCRAFLPTPVPEKIVRENVERAARAPSAGNMQPWRVYAIAGRRIEELKALMAPRMAAERPKGEGTDYTIYPEPLAEPYRARRHGRRNALSVDQRVASIGSILAHRTGRTSLLVLPAV